MAGRTGGNEGSEAERLVLLHKAQLHKQGQRKIKKFDKLNSLLWDTIYLEKLNIFERWTRPLPAIFLAPSLLWILPASSGSPQTAVFNATWNFRDCIFVPAFHKKQETTRILLFRRNTFALPGRQGGVARGVRLGSWQCRTVKATK